MITLNSVAAQKFKEIASKTANPENQMLRIFFKGYGWGGPRWGLTLDELKKDYDIIQESNGIKIVYDNNIASELGSLIIDYSDKWYNRGFYISGSCWWFYLQIWQGQSRLYPPIGWNSDNRRLWNCQKYWNKKNPPGI